MSARLPSPLVLLDDHSLDVGELPWQSAGPIAADHAGPAPAIEMMLLVDGKVGQANRQRLGLVAGGLKLDPRALV
jgi:hypothetical protein